ncbi:MAG: glycosyltransferase [Sulfurimonas sp.]|jgi:glycosyltransferase involved in cell wall biosynthesis
MKFKKEVSNTALICLSPNFGGMEIDAIKLAKKLSIYSNVVVIAKYAGYIHNNLYEYGIDNKVVLKSIDFSSSLSMSIFFNVRAILKEHKIKNIVYFGASELKTLYFAFLGFDLNLIIRHGTTKSKPKKDFFHELIYSKVDYHVSICKHLQKNVEHIIPFAKKSKSILIYPAIEAKEIEKIPHDKLALAHVGRIAKGKGQQDAIEACKILYEKNIDFVFYIIGGFEEKYKDEFMFFYNSLVYKDKIKLIGFTTEVDDYLAKSDIFLFPSHAEGFGNAFLEALKAGLFAICYENTSFKEFREMGLDFDMAKDRNIDDLKKCLEHAIYTIKNRSTNKNKEIIDSIFNLENEVKQYLSILI